MISSAGIWWIGYTVDSRVYLHSEENIRIRFSNCSQMWEMKEYIHTDTHTQEYNLDNWIYNKLHISLYIN